MIFWSSPLDGVPARPATEDHKVWGEISPEDDEGLPGFKPSEFNRPWEMDVAFLRWLHQVRLSIHAAMLVGQIPNDVPMRVNSDARPVGGSTGATASAHKSRPCRAVDLQVYSSYARSVIVTAAVHHGCRRIGVYPGKDRSDERGWPAWARDASGLHIDCSTEHPTPRIWTRW